MHKKYFIKKFQTIFAITILSLATQSAMADCGHTNVTITGATAYEQETSCMGLEKLLSYFQSMGIKKEPQLHLIFQDEVYLPGGMFGEKVQVHGYFDTDTNEIYMTHLEAKSEQQRRPWNQEWTKAMSSSMLWHEMTHLLAINYMGKDFKRLNHAWHELIAYSVQFELMDASLRKQILAQKEYQPFTDVSEVSSELYEMNPEVFAIISYLSVQKWGGSSFLKRLLDNQVKGI